MRIMIALSLLVIIACSYKAGYIEGSKAKEKAMLESCFKLCEGDSGCNIGCHLIFGDVK